MNKPGEQIVDNLGQCLPISQMHRWQHEQISQKVGAVLQAGVTNCGL